MLGYRLEAIDETIGRCDDFLLDDRHWTTRYMVASTGTWLLGRKVLISPVSLRGADAETKRFAIGLTRAQIEAAPSLDEDAPVSRQHERHLFDHYGWPYYWSGTALWGSHAIPSQLAVNADLPPPPQPEPEAGSRHLRSVRELTGYGIVALGEEIGKVHGFVVDDTTWATRYVIADTGGWLSGRRVLIAPSWIREIRWADRVVLVDLRKEEIEKSPEYDPRAPINREYEVRLYDYYGRPRYWHS